MKKKVAKRPAPKRFKERDVVKQAVEAATGVPFEEIALHPAFPLPLEKVEWFMRCRKGEEITKAQFLNTAWKEKGAGMWLESLAVGDTVDWIELAYGEDKASDSLGADYSIFDEPEFQKTFGQKFPLVLERIKEYRDVAKEVSKRKGVDVRIRHAGSKGILVFTVAALVKVRKGGSAASLSSAVKKSAEGLRDAYEKVVKL